MTLITCPCCDGVGEIEEQVPVPLSPMQYRIYDIVRRAKYGIALSALVDRVYASDVDGGPITGYNSVHVQIVRANARLAKANLRIGSDTRGEGTVLRLQHLSSS